MACSSDRPTTPPHPGVAGLVNAIRLQRVPTATALIMFASPNRSIIASIGGGGPPALPKGSLAGIRSVAVVRKALKQLRLPDTPAAADAVIKRIEVQPHSGTLLVDVTLHDPDPVRAVRLVNAIVQTYKNQALAQSKASIRTAMKRVSTEIAKREAAQRELPPDGDLYRINEQRLLKLRTRLEEARLTLESMPYPVRIVDLAQVRR